MIGSKSLICQLGPSYGYYLEPKKTVVVVDENDVDAANACFHDLGIKVLRGHHCLGGFIGDEEHMKRFVDEKVKDWMSHVLKLAKAAEHYPQAAYAALSKSMQFEWSFLQRVIQNCSASFLCLRDQINANFWPAILDGVIPNCSASFLCLRDQINANFWPAILDGVIPNCSASFLCLRDQINANFWPAILDGDVSASELSLFILPARLGGMGINDPVDSAGIAFSTSRTCTKKIVDAIKGHGKFFVFDHNNQMHEAKKQQKVALNTSQQSTLASIMTSLSGDKKHAVKRAVDSKASIWLTVIAVSHHHFNLSPTEFRDALALRYHRLFFFLKFSLNVMAVVTNSPFSRISYSAAQ